MFDELYQKMIQYKPMLKATNIENTYIFGEIGTYTYHLFEHEIKHQNIYPYSIEHYLCNEKHSIIHVNYIFPAIKQVLEFFKGLSKNL